MASDARPRSCTGWADPFVAQGAVGLLFWIGSDTSLLNSTTALILVAGVFLALAPLEIWRAPWRRQPSSSDVLWRIILRAYVKLFGCAAGLAIIASLYWLLPEYRKPFYEPFFAVLWQLRVLIPCVIVYFFYAEWRFPAGNDGYWQMGMLALGQYRSVDYTVLKRNVLTWLLRGFFLPIMFGDLVAGVEIMRLTTWDSAASVPLLVDNVIVACFTFELAVVVAGYAAPCRLLDNYIREVESTGAGWFATLICYGPFYSFLFAHYFAYRSEVGWDSWLADWPIARGFWGTGIIIVVLVHLWSDSCLGLRFSNLTNRGIVTNGAYRFCKHPAYLFKNIGWWLMSVPFVAGGETTENIRLSLLLAGTNLIYFWRSAREERLLSRDPHYAAYAGWMERHGPLRFIGSICPALRFSSRQRKWAMD
jgi:isoprenylcysteine carboxyl methyltransferase (ICMT) family protein YpbQ